MADFLTTSRVVGGELSKAVVPPGAALSGTARPQANERFPVMDDSEPKNASLIDRHVGGLTGWRTDLWRECRDP